MCSNVDDELHGGVIVVQEHDLEQGRTLGLRQRLIDDQAVVVLWVFLAHLPPVQSSPLYRAVANP
jgi:hypothetical protein